jgi:hypothetical protein
MESKKVYYSHSKKIYSTPREEVELQYLLKKFKDVCNPHTEIRSSEMYDYLQAVKNCSKVIASEYKHYIGKGVFTELETAIREEIPCFVLRKFLKWFYLKKIKNIQVKNPNNWKVKFGKIIT